MAAHVRVRRAAADSGVERLLGDLVHASIVAGGRPGHNAYMRHKEQDDHH